MVAVKGEKKVLLSLRFRMWLLMLLITALALFACGWIYYSTAQSAIRNSLIDSAKMKALTASDSLAVRLDTLLKRADAIGESLSAAVDIDRTAAAEDVSIKALRREFASQKSFVAMGLADLKGTLRMADGRTFSILDEPGWQSASVGGRSFSHTFNPSSDRAEPWIGLFVPVYDRSQALRAVLWTATPVATVAEGLRPIEGGDGKEESFWLADSDGQAIYTTVPPATASDLQAGIARALADNRSAAVGYGADKLFPTDVAGTSWRLVLAVPKDVLYKPLHVLLERTIGICIALEWVLGVVLLLLMTPLFRRIAEISRTTEAVAAGNFQVKPLAPGLRDEIGSLALSVNGMVEQLRALFEPLQAVTNQNDYGIIVTDENYLITQFNETAQRMLGYTSDEVVGKMTPLDLSSMEDLTELSRRRSIKMGEAIEPGLTYFRSMLRDRMSYSEERMYVRKGGQQIPVFLNVSKIVDNEGKITGYVGLFRDITKQKRIQEELTQAKRIAEEANQIKGLFLARMSHEIRTPINGIVGLSQLMMHTELTEAQRDYMQKVVASSDVLLGIVNDILDFSKIEAGKIELEKVAFEPDALFQKLADTLSIFLSKKQLEMLFDVPNDLPRTLLGDPLRLEQVLLNLSNNAIKFTSEGHVLLQVRKLAETDGRVMLAFMVEDTGIGISASQLETLFQPFVQVDGSTSRKYGGTGLGLVIASELVELMGGKLEVESKPGEGSRFSFTLTLDAAPAPEEADVIPVRPPGEPRATVLCIEKPGLQQMTLRTMLLPYDLNVTFADSWKMAFAELGEEGRRFEFILCDMEMSDMYGEETWRRLLRLAGAAKVIAMTTPFGQNEWMRLDEDERPYRTFIKPLNRKSLRILYESIVQETLAGRAEAAAGREKRVVGEVPRILLAEDNAINQQIACELLSGKGYITGVASNGLEAIRLVREEHWDLVLMDIQMPEMDGIEAARKIREERGAWRLPIVAMTANVLPEDLKKCYNAGMNDAIIKPIQADVLFEVVARWTKHSRQLDWDEALQRVNGKEQILRHMLRTFGEEYEGFEAMLADKLAKGEWEEVYKRLHALKGVSGNLSAKALFAAASRLERFAAMPPGSLREEQAWRPAFEELTRALRELLEAIEREGNGSSVIQIM